MRQRQSQSHANPAGLFFFARLLAIHRKTQAFALFSGICYQHEEDYLGAQGNSQKPGIWMLNEVDGTGNAELLQVSLNYLRRRYG